MTRNTRLQYIRGLQFGSPFLCLSDAGSNPKPRCSPLLHSAGHTIKYLKGGRDKAVPVRTIKAYGGVVVQRHSFLTLALDGGCAVSLTFRRL